MRHVVMIFGLAGIVAGVGAQATGRRSGAAIHEVEGLLRSLIGVTGVGLSGVIAALERHAPSPVAPPATRPAATPPT